MTAPKLYADREALGHTDAEVEAMIRQATADLHQRLEAALQCVGTLRGDIDGLTRKLEEACAAEQRAAIRAGEWMLRVEVSNRERDEAEARGRSQGRVDVAKYSRAIGEIEAALGYSGARPLSETVAAVRQLKAERDEAQANYRFMVERAADQKLDGYRELGARAARAESERDEVRRQVATARRETAIALQCVSILRSENLQLVAQWERTFGAGER